MIDEQEFHNAKVGLNKVSDDLQEMHDTVRELLSDLNSKFDTPAGHTLYKAFDSSVLTSLLDQKKIIDHLVESLEEVEKKYSLVFSEYNKLNNDLNNLT